MLVEMLRGVLGMSVLVGLCWLCSERRRAINWDLVLKGVGLQVILAVILLLVPLASDAVGLVSGLFVSLLGHARAGATLVFGDVASDPSLGGTIAFEVLPSIIFFSALSALLYYLGLMQRVVYAMAWLMSRTMKLSGAESLAAAANVFVGQTEAPLAIRPYLATMSRSELFCLMTGGLATIAGGVMVAYIGMLGGGDPTLELAVGKQLLTASVLSAPAAIVVAKLLVPETADIDVRMQIDRGSWGTNAFEALVSGTSSGVKLALNVGAMLIVFTALIAALNDFSENWIGEVTGLNSVIAEWTGGRFSGFSLSFVFALVFAPVAWLIGVDAPNLLPVGQLLAEKTVLNEFVAYQTMGHMMEQGQLADTRTQAIATYALCGFANFASLGILIGGVSTLAPQRRSELAQFAWRALLGGTVACLMTACLAGMIYG